MEENYERLVAFIAQHAGLSVEEVMRKVVAKQEKLSGLISKEGAAQVIAAELNINFDKQIVKIAHLVVGMRKINLIGKVVGLSPIREYSKNGRSGRIGSFTLADDSSNIRTVLWDENHIDLIAGNHISEGSVVEIGNASIRNGELHLGSFSEIKVSDKVLEGVVLEKPLSHKQIKDFIPNEPVAVRAFVVQLFEPKFFSVCPECKKKVNGEGMCAEHGKVVALRRSLVSFVLDDGTDSIRSTLFSEVLEKLISKETIEDQELFARWKTEMLGKEIIATGMVRRNQMFDSNDFVVNQLADVEFDALIVELER